MNNNKKILKRSSAAFLAALNIFNFAGGSSKALNPWNILLYKFNEEKIKKIDALNEFLDLLEDINFENFKVSNDNAQLSQLTSISIKNFADFYKFKDKEVLLIDFVGNGVSNGDIKDTVVSKVKGPEYINSGFVVYKIEGGAADAKKSAIEKALNAGEDIIFINVDNIEHLKSYCKQFKRTQELEKGKKKLEEAKNEAEKKLTQAQKDLDTEKANVQEANKEKEKLKKEKNELQTKINEAEKAKDEAEEAKKSAEEGKKKSEEENKELKEEKKKSEEENKELKEENEKFIMYACINKVLKKLVKFLQEKCNGETLQENATSLVGVQQDIAFEGVNFKLVGEDDDSFLGNVKFKYKYKDEKMVSINELICSLSSELGVSEITKLESIKLDDIKKSVTKEDVLNVAVYKEKLKEYIEKLNKIIETIGSMPGACRKLEEEIETLKSNENTCKGKAKNVLNTLNKTSGLSGTLEEQLNSIKQGVDEFKRAKNDLDTKLKTANSKARKLGATAVLGWVGTLVSLGCVFQNELKNACGTVYKKVLELKNSILG